MKKYRVAALVLGVLILFGLMPGTAFAQGQITKDETVYVNLAGDGGVDAVYVVNAFESRSEGSVTDYGDYKNVKNMTTSDPMAFENGKSSLDLPAGRFYYQGEMAHNALPWKVGISYLLNGKTAAADELAGTTGRLEIRIEVDRGDERYSSFYNNYVVQIAYTLDAEKCLNIKSENANIVTAGSNVSITYTMMQESDAKQFVLTADVKDFEMSAIQLRAVHNDTDIDTDEFEQKLDDIQTDFEELADGVNQPAGQGWSRAFERALSRRASPPPTPPLYR